MGGGGDVLSCSQNPDGKSERRTDLIFWIKQPTVTVFQFVSDFQGDGERKRGQMRV